MLTHDGDIFLWHGEPVRRPVPKDSDLSFAIADFFRRRGPDWSGTPTISARANRYRESKKVRTCQDCRQEKGFRAFKKGSPVCSVCQGY